MSLTINIKVRTCSQLAVALSFLLMTINACKAPENIFTIGVITSTSTGNTAYEGFLAGMTHAGYVEGRNISYILKDVNEEDEQDVDSRIRELLGQDIDLLVAFGRQGSFRAKELTKGTDMPVLFCGNAWPVEDGLVESINHPGGNITGVKPANSIAKSLEWLKYIVPGLRKVWVPYNPDENLSVAELPALEKAASQLGIELVLAEIRSIKEAVAAIETLPEEINAIFSVPTSVIDPKNAEISQAAIKRRIPVGASIQMDDAVLITLTNDFYNAGEKTAWLAQQIHKGIKPADLPVETSEVKLIINLRTAEEIGLNIPDDMLGLATTIIR